VIITAILKHFICIFSLYKMMGFIVAFSYIYITYLDHIHPLLTLFCPLPFHRSPSSALVISFCFYHFQTPHVTDFSSQSGLFCLIWWSPVLWHDFVLYDWIIFLCVYVMRQLLLGLRKYKEMTF
jgi:hypothetical protein